MGICELTYTRDNTNYLCKRWERSLAYVHGDSFDRAVGAPLKPAFLPFMDGWIQPSLFQTLLGGDSRADPEHAGMLIPSDLEKH